MPRPKVRPEDRQRIGQACLLCRASKIRCDSAFPCISCVNRGRATQCEYPKVDRRRLIKGSGRRQRKESHEPLIPSPQTDNLPVETVTQPESQSSLHLEPQPTPTRMLSPTSDAEASRSPVTTTMAGLSTDKVRVSHGSPSFLRFLRTTLRPFVGHARFTNNDGHDFSSQEEPEPNFDVAGNLSSQKMYSLLDSYFEATSGLLDVFSAEEIDSLIERQRDELSLETGSVDCCQDLAALNVALAIGAQYLPLTESDTSLASSLYSRGREAAFTGMLKTTSLSTIRLFLLMAFYSLGTCQRSTAAMDLAIAAKAAGIVGLQMGASQQVGPDGSRSRLWGSLRIFDILASFVLGQGLSLPTSLVDNGLSEAMTNDMAWSGKVATSAVFQGCNHIETIVTVLRNGGILHVPTAESLLDQLRQWIRSQPDSLRTFSFGEDVSNQPSQRQQLIGHIHVSCLYYFAVLLVTRPYLVAYLMSRLRGRAPDHLIDDPDAASDFRIKNNKVSKLAQVCVSSACYIAETLHTLKIRRFDFGNLCLIQAWAYGSGLVLGFSMFAGEPRQDIVEAFSFCKGVLQVMGERFIQAQTYLDILNSFQEAVNQYHQQVSTQVQNTVHDYMDHVLVIESPNYQGDVHSELPNLGLDSTSDASCQPHLDDVDNVLWQELQIRYTEHDFQIVDDYLNLDLGSLQGFF